MAGAAASVTITGTEELSRKLKSLGADLKKELSRAGLKAMILHVETPARDKCQPHIDNGALTSPRGIFTVEEEEKGQTLIKTGSNLVYAKYMEYGTGIYAENGDGRKTPWLWKVESRKWAAILGIERGDSILWHGSRPHPSLRPAFAEGKDKVMESVKTDLKSSVARYTK